MFLAVHRLMRLASFLLVAMFRVASTIRRYICRVASPSPPPSQTVCSHDAAIRSSVPSHLSEREPLKFAQWHPLFYRSHRWPLQRAARTPGEARHQTARISISPVEEFD